MKLKKGNLVMEVSTDVQASAFLKAGYEIVTEKTPTIEEKTKRVSRKKNADNAK